jgi:hypothetical protein
LRGGNRRHVRTIDVWPGFVDALATLVIAVVFVMMVFAVFQFYLKDVIAGRDDQLARASAQLAELASTLAMERRESRDLNERFQALVAEMQATLAERERLRGEAEAATALSAQRAKELEDANRSIEIDRAKFEVQLRELEALAAMRLEMEKRLAAAEETATSERQLSSQAQAQVALLNRQTAELREQLRRLEALLSESEKKSAESQAQIADLGRRLNLALASRVEELSRFRTGRPGGSAHRRRPVRVPVRGAVRLGCRDDRAGRRPPAPAAGRGAARGDLAHPQGRGLGASDYRPHRPAPHRHARVPVELGAVVGARDLGRALPDGQRPARRAPPGRRDGRVPAHRRARRRGRLAAQPAHRAAPDQSVKDGR